MMTYMETLFLLLFSGFTDVLWNKNLRILKG